MLLHGRCGLLLAAIKTMAAGLVAGLEKHDSGSRNATSAQSLQDGKIPARELQLDLLAMLGSAVDGILVADVETRHFVFANTAICEMLGYSADELSLLTVKDIHPPEALPAVQRHFEQILQTKTRTPADHEVMRKDGSTFCATISTSLLVSDGRDYAVGFFHDITDRKRAADDLARRDRALHAVMLGAAHLVSAETFKAGIPEALRIVGEALDVDRVVVVRERMGGPELESIWERDGIPVSLSKAGFSLSVVDPRIIDEWRVPLRSGRAVIAQYDDACGGVRRLLDAVHAQSILLMPIFATGEFYGNIGVDACRGRREWTVGDIDVLATFASLIGALIVHDETSQSLRRSEEQFRAVAETARDAIVMAIPSGRVRYWNPGAERMFGYSAAEAAGRGPIMDWLVPAAFHEESVQVMAEFAASGAHDWMGRVVERLVRCRDGHEMPVEMSVQPVTLQGEQCTVALMHDVTERKEAEAALATSEAQLSSALKIARAGHWVYDVVRDEFTFNDNFYALFRTTAAEVGGYVMRSADYAQRFCHPDDAAMVGREVAAAIDTTDPNYNVELEHRVIFGDGQSGWIAVRIFIVKDNAGRTIRSYGVNQDITERKRNEEALRRLNRTLRTLTSTNRALIHATGEQQLLDAMCRIAVEVGGYAMAWVGLLAAPDRLTPTAHAGDGAQEYLRSMATDSAETVVACGPTGDAIRTGETQIDHAFAADPAAMPWRIAARNRGIKSSIALPLKHEERVLGAISIYANETDFFDAAEVRLLNELADDTGFGISSLRARADRIAARQRLRHGLEVTVEALASTVERRDAYTAGHQRKVSEIATAIARRLGLSEDVVNGLRLASIIHDVGKVQVPAEILSKPGRLTPPEFALIKEHAQAGYEIVKDIDFPWPVAETILQHHERLDGSGYPKGLKGDDILIEAKILAVADVIEAMMSHRPYRAALGLDAALAEIEAGSGKLYDPKAVGACVALFQEGILPGDARH